MKRLADPGPPGSASVDVTVLVVLVTEPTTEPSLFTLIPKLQLAPAGRLAPLNVIRLLPAGAPIVPPSHTPVSPFGVDITRPAGSMSENARASSVTILFGFARVSVRVVSEPGVILTSPNALVRVGGEATITVASAVLPVPPLEEVTCTELL